MKYLPSHACKTSLRQLRKSLLVSGAILLALAGTKAVALGLGTIHVDSMFGQPFVGSVEIFNAEGYDESTIAVSLASREVHEQLGVTRSFYLDNLSFEVVFEPSGSAQILVIGHQPLDDPYIEFALEMRWPEGRIVRDYTVLVNMPTASTPLRLDATETITTRSKSPIPHSSLYTIEGGDTLSEIVERLEGREVSMSNALKTLRAHNASLMERRGSLGLRIGDRLRIPAKNIFSQPVAPVQTVNSANTSRKTAAVVNPSAAVTDKDSSEVGSPLARAETRLRALGYANVQMQAAGETPNPIIASGAAAAILEQLIAEQSGSDASYGTTQVGRLTQGLNEVSNISRAYQQRLSALEEATKANAEALASLAKQREQIADVPQLVLAENPPVAQPAELPKSTSENSPTPAPDTPTTGRAFGWLFWLSIFIAAIGALLLAFYRHRPAPAPAESYVVPTPATELETQSKPDPVDEGEDSQLQEESVAPEEASENLEQIAVEQEDDSKATPFYEELTAIEESEAAEPQEDLETELDEELKLISIFEEKLASETAVRTQIKQEEADAEPLSTVIQEDILDFDLESLEPEENLEFVLDESEPSSSEAEPYSSTDELLNWDEAPQETLAAENVGSESQVSDPGTTTSSPNNYSGYAETAGFSQINTVEVIEIVNKKLQAAKSADQETTLFYIEIDQFDALEKELGIVRAEKLAANIASNIYDRIENPITLRRFRQQGFVLLLSGGQNQQNLQFGQELASAISSTPIEVSGETFFTTLSIGVVPVASGFANSAEIIEMAQKVVNQVREENNGDGALLCELDPDTAHNEASIMRAGRKLLNDKSLITVYQPVTALKGDPLEFYEARLRVADGIDSKAFPDDLIERLGNTDLSTEIDCFNVSQSLGELNDYLNSHISTRVFITISARTATDNFFRNWFEKTMFTESIHPERIVFQMTEQSVSRHLNNLLEFRDYAHNLGARICISHLDFEHIPEHAMARLHPDFVQLHPGLAESAQLEGEGDQDLEKQRQGLARLTEVLEKARPLSEKIVVPGVSQAKIIPTLWPLSVDYILGDYIQPESLAMDYEFGQVAE